MTLFQLYNEGRELLDKSGSPDPEQDARLFLLAAFNLEPARYLLNRMQELSADESGSKAIERYREMLIKRQQRQPLQHILGCQDFMGLTFLVNEHVLIPRQDTETLVELVLAEQDTADHRILDLCTGSGCIAISLAIKGGYRSVTATDISEQALQVAAKNCERLCDQNMAALVSFLQGDLFHALDTAAPDQRVFDVITANPPYIPTAVIATLEPEVRDFEPILALDGTADGLRYYRILASEAKHYLAKHGTIYMEIGYDQGAAVSRLFEEQGYQNVRVVKDLQQNDRVVCAAWS